MKKLTYNTEMQEQDKLWEENKDDIVGMEKMFHAIINEAVLMGYKEKYAIYPVGNTEVICELFEKQEDRQDNYVIGKDCFFSCCKTLIKKLEYILNRQ